MIIKFYVEAVESVELKDWQIGLAHEFGGFTKYQARGAYVNHKNHLEFENSYVFEVVSKDSVDLHGLDLTVADLAQELKRICRQESVLVTIQKSEVRLFKQEILDNVVDRVKNIITERK